MQAYIFLKTVMEITIFVHFEGKIENLNNRVVSNKSMQDDHYCRIKYAWRHVYLIPKSNELISALSKKMCSNCQKCICGHSINGMNCAHYLTNWLIVTGQLKEKPSQSTFNCSKGRPIRSKDMRNIFTGIKMILVLLQKMIQ